VSQVIATLLDNALTHGGGTVTVRTSQTPRSVVTEVRDEGKGIPADLVHRIFERSVSGAGGTGLGLALPSRSPRLTAPSSCWRGHGVADTTTDGEPPARSPSASAAFTVTAPALVRTATLCRPVSGWPSKWISRRQALEDQQAANAKLTEQG
jgi:hypothetical protein